MLDRSKFDDEFAYKTFSFLIKIIGDFFKDREINGVEIGTMKGASAFWLMSELKNISHLYTVDPWSYVENSTMEQARPRDFHEINYYDTLDLLKPLSSRVTIVRDFSDDFFNYAIKKNMKFDFIWIDGHHEKFQVDKDISNAKLLIKDDGLILGHDFINCQGVRDGVAEAFSGKKVFLNKESQIWFVYGFNEKDSPLIIEIN